MKTFQEYLQEKKFAGEHHAVMLDYKTKNYKSIRRQNDKFGAGIDVTWGIPNKGATEIIDVIFDKDKYSPAEAKKWMKDHKMKFTKFTVAGK